MSSPTYTPRKSAAWNRSSPGQAGSCLYLCIGSEPRTGACRCQRNMNNMDWDKKRSLKDVFAVIHPVTNREQKTTEAIFYCSSPLPKYVALQLALPPVTCARKHSASLSCHCYPHFTAREAESLASLPKVTQRCSDTARNRTEISSCYFSQDLFFQRSPSIKLSQDPRETPSSKPHRRTQPE